MMNKFLFFFGLMLATLVHAQPDKQSVVNKVKELCPAADIVELEFKDNHVEVEYWCNGSLVEIGINQQTDVIFTETEAEIPADVMRKILHKLEKKYYGWVYDDFAFVQLSDTSFYKVELLKGGVEENIYFTTDGKYYKTKNVVVNESWDLNILRKSDRFKHAPYDFLSPYKSFDMPEPLKEISGIARAGGNTMFCVQDETGIIFKYNLERDELAGMLRFTDLGDFEDIALLGDTAYILRSDGTLFFFNHARYNGKYEKTVVPLNCLNIEGLCYDKTANSFLVSCKDQQIGSFGAYRHVYAFSPSSKHLPEISFTIDLDEINAMFNKNFPALVREKLQFNPSAIAVHPLTKQRYVLSASNRLLAIYYNNTLIDVYPLPAELYFKPEGLDFAENGDLYISNEGMKKGYLGGSILLLQMRQR